MGWEQFFSIYPFTQEREDARTAALLMTITNMSGRQVKKLTGIQEYLPAFTNEDRSRLKAKTLDQQIADDTAFGNKLAQLKALQ